MRLLTCLLSFLVTFCALEASSEPLNSEEDLLAVRSACASNSYIAEENSAFSIALGSSKSGDLPYFEIKSVKTTNFVRIYFEPKLAAAAKTKAGCLIGLLDLLAPNIPEQRRHVHWSAMVLTTKQHYIPAKKKDELLWVNVLENGVWDEKSIYFLVHAMPHEEVHLSQGRSKSQLPRWFLEGHAEWAAIHVTEQVRPDLASKRRQELSGAFSELKSARLKQWGGIKVKQEAIDRQLTAEDRKRMASDPTYSPPEPFTFGPGDYTEDDENETGRYGAALALFDDLEKRFGMRKVHTWIKKVMESTDAQQVTVLAAEVFGQDIQEYLK